MAERDVMSSFWRGFRNGIPFLLIVVPFSMLFGVVATEAGLNLWETLGFSVVVIAGAAQFTAIQLMKEDAPTLVILISALAVNMRMAMYSAAITPHLGKLALWKRALTAYMLVDQTYGSSVMDYEENPDQTPAQKFGYFLGVCVPIIPVWYAGTAVGALAGTAVPANSGLDFALPITFIAMVAPGLKTAAHRSAAFVAVVVSLLLAGLPFNLGLLGAALAGMMVGAEMERRGYGP